jgi:acyl carrier protein phosphodiesterase
MNFLAHALLAGDDPALVVGGVVGDWIKGPLPAGLPPDLARGVALHRAIDSHAETHPAFRRSRARVSPRAGAMPACWWTSSTTTCWRATGRRCTHQPFAEFRHTSIARDLCATCRPAGACALRAWN